MPNCLTLKKSNCKNCYKCIRHCPVKSIRFSGNQAHIIGNECILCGQCFVVCPQNAKEIVDEREKVKVLLNSGAPVIVSLAPSFAANYDGVGIDSMRVALKKLGFAGVEETALGATMVKREYERMLKEEQRDILISSCCHSINLLIQKYYPEALEYLADVKSPMQAHCSDIKRRMPQAKTVFIGPCVAKKDEAEHYEGIVDAVMTFEELTKWLDEEQITLEQKRDSDQDTRARFFPTTGGILKTMEQDAPGYTYLAIDGVENCIAALKDIENGKLHHCFVEMSACVGSCVGGPVMEKYHRTPVKDYMAIATYAGKRDFDVEQPEKGELQKHMEPIVQKSIKPSESGDHGHPAADGQDEAFRAGAQLRLLRLQHLPGKGHCHLSGQGRNFHVSAVLEGKGRELLRQHRQQHAQRHLIVLNENLEVQQINKRRAADHEHPRRLRRAGRAGGAHHGSQGVSWTCSRRAATSVSKRAYLAEYKKYVEQTVVYDTGIPAADLHHAGRDRRGI